MRLSLAKFLAEICSSPQWWLFDSVTARPGYRTGGRPHVVLLWVSVFLKRRLFPVFPKNL
jgi:hypothetical protein